MIAFVNKVSWDTDTILKVMWTESTTIKLLTFKKKKKKEATFCVADSFRTHQLR